MSVTPLDPRTATIMIDLQNSIERSFAHPGKTGASAGFIALSGHGFADNMPAGSSNAR